MSLFGKIMDKIFHRDKAAAPAPTPQAAPAPAPAPQAAPAAPTAAPAQPVDVEAVLAEMASQDAAGGGNWRTSIVDLLKLLDLDSSLQARKELAEELNVHGGDHGSAEQNIALQKAVMKKLAENGGKVPDSLKD
jgi:3-oxoacyl-ACP reductase-like protein